jgi:hypothetical protein
MLIWNYSDDSSNFLYVVEWVVKLKVSIIREFNYKKNRYFTNCMKFNDIFIVFNQFDL